MIRLLVVDDSPLMRRLLSDIFGQQEDFVVATARSGDEAIVSLTEFKPDVVTLDIHMPGMDGLQCLDRIMLERPTPVVMVSSLTAEGADETLEAMSLGAVDFVPKPGGAITLKIDELAPTLVEKVRAASKARISHTSRLAERVRLRGATAKPIKKVARAARQAVPVEWTSPDEGAFVLIGTSTGGPPALDAVLTALPASFPWPILVAQHMPASFTGQLARRLDKACALTVSEVSKPTPIEPGNIYIGKGDTDLIVTRRGTRLVAMAAPEDPEKLWHPSADRLVESALASVAPERLIGVLMTGMGADGAETMTQLHARGGLTIAEAEESAVVWGMPGALVDRGGAAMILPLDRIAGALLELARPR
ncbi:chemotaxis response regulator protein-glutamate methylesterase [Nostoc sp. 3335mG]|nr:chemotaxis response regulator protein-glutamate methylesterase [Nostoc sp. 3335mG]